MDEVNNYTCICDTGYTGRYCEIEIDYCSPPPCLNNGSCNSYPGYYTCNCQEGFNGTECENNIDDCVPNPCLNGGTCNDIVRQTLDAKISHSLFIHFFVHSRSEDSHVPVLSGGLD